MAVSGHYRMKKRIFLKNKKREREEEEEKRFAV